MKKNADQTAISTSVFYIKPQPGYVICESLKEEKVGNFQIADTMADKDSGGVVVAVGEPILEWHGEECTQVNPPVKVGDKVVYANYGAQRYMDFKTGRPLMFLKFSEIIGVIKE